VMSITGAQPDDILQHTYLIKLFSNRRLCLCILLLRHIRSRRK